MNALMLKSLSVHYGSHQAVRQFSATLSSGEMVTILGPSGCGKSSLLKAIAGIEEPSAGSIILDGKILASYEQNLNLSPNKREIGFVFQNYALWPHLTVFQNVAYPLQCKNIPKNEQEVLVRDTLSLFRLSDKAACHPNQLSGGEQQRVALARAIVMRPKVLLMDEPLSSLDAKLRFFMRGEIQRVQKQLGITCLYVTHDQSEALSLADRIIVMRNGQIEQIGTPEEIYDRPRSVFVADFIGQANLLSLRLSAKGEGWLTAYLEDTITITSACNFKVEETADEMVVLLCRPQHITLGSLQKGKPKGTIIEKEFMGSHIQYRLSVLDGQELWVHVPYHKRDAQCIVGESVSYVIDADAACFLLREK